MHNGNQVMRPVLLLLAAFAMGAWAQPMQPDAEVVARLVEIPGKLPVNELYNYVYIFKYKIIKVVSGKVDAKEILVGVYNPREPRDQVKDRMDPMVEGSLKAFEAGAIHRIKLIQPLDKIWKDAIEDEYFDMEDPRWYGFQVDLEQP